MPHSIAGKTDKWMRILVFALMIAGAALRLYIYLQNRNLIIDEANVARNIYERGFVALLQPLSYEQYAPPIFLWITKLNALLFGMGEMALRLYPLLCGLGALWLFYKIATRLVPLQAAWFPVSLLAFSGIFIRYSSELKQYMPDVFIALLLIWLALVVNMATTSTRRFTLLWMIVGSIAVWSSMPSVFILAGVGSYYGWQAVSAKEYNRLPRLVLIVLVWVAQFVAYFLLILKEQANSDYLQNFHQYDFLFATPSSRGEWQHNWYVFSALMRQFEGVHPYVHDINTAFLLAGAIMLARKSGARFFLLATPVLTLCIAAALNQFSLMVRVSLFIIPVLMLIAGYGFAQYYYLRQVWMKGIILAAGLYAAGCNIAHLTEWRYQYEELTEGLAYLREKKVDTDKIYIYHGSIPAFVYYTEMHPDKEQWSSMKGVHLLSWQTVFVELGKEVSNSWDGRPVGFIYTSTTEQEFRDRHNMFSMHMQAVDSISKPYLRAFIYTRRDE